MRRTILALVAVALLIPAAAAQDMRKGLNAYKRGDYAAALKEWRALAERGHAGAQYNIGFNYIQGKGVPKDFVQAYFWFELAARQGKRVARDIRNGIAAQMTADQIARAQALFREWVAAHPNP